MVIAVRAHCNPLDIYIHMYTRTIRLHQFILQICFMGQQRGCCLPNHQEYSRIYIYNYIYIYRLCLSVLSSNLT